MLSRSDMVKTGVGIGIVGLTSGAIGTIHGRKGVMPALGPVPLDAAVAGGALALALSGALGRATPYVVDVCKGATGYFAGSLGAQIGQRMRKKSTEGLGVTTVGSIENGWLTGTRTITKGEGPNSTGAYPAFAGHSVAGAPSAVGPASRGVYSHQNAAHYAQGSR